MNELIVFIVCLWLVLFAFSSEITDDKNVAATSGDDFFIKRWFIFVIVWVFGLVYVVMFGFNVFGVDFDLKVYVEFYDESVRAFFIAWLRE